MFGESGHRISLGVSPHHMSGSSSVHTVAPLNGSLVEVVRSQGGRENRVLFLLSLGFWAQDIKKCQAGCSGGCRKDVSLPFPAPSRSPNTLACSSSALSIAGSDLCLHPRRPDRCRVLENGLAEVYLSCGEIGPALRLSHPLLGCTSLSLSLILKCVAAVGLD